jgi:hypothetical protein
MATRFYNSIEPEETMEDVTTLPRTLTDTVTHRPASGLRDVLGTREWQRLPESVRARFDEHAAAIDYAGSYEVVRASRLGRVFAWLGRMIGTPVVPGTGENVGARVRVRPITDGVRWLREYSWEDGSGNVVRSTKVVTADGRLIEKLPARLHMPLRVYVEGHALHFVSEGYYFDLGLGLRLWLPPFLSPGVTHVEHVDLAHGWFRFTLSVEHRWFGEMFFQTGRFCETDLGR